MKYDLQFKEHLEDLYLKKANANAINVFLEFELTGKCRNTCFFCGNFSQSHAPELEFKQLKKFIKKISSYYLRKGKRPILSICGGDPALYSYFDELLLFLDRSKLPFVIKGNPSTIDEDHVYLLQNHGCMAVKFTYLGDTKLHNETRGNETVADLLEKTKMFQSMEMPVLWNLSVGQFNMDSIVESLPFIHEARPDSIMIGRLADIGKMKDTKENNQNNDMTAPEFKKFLMSLLNYYYKNYENGFHLSFKEKLWVPLLAELGLLDIEKLNIPPEHLGCDAYCRSFNVNSSGEISLCGLLSTDQPAALSEFDIENVLKLRTLSMKNNSYCHDCKYGPYCQGCRAIALANTGDVYAKDPHCWL